MKKVSLFFGVLIIAAWLSGIPLHGAEAIVPPSGDFFIVSPAPGEVITGSTVHVVVSLPTGMQLHSPVTQNQEGEGHLHLWLDPPAGGVPEHDTATSVVLAEKPEYTFEQVTSGLHTLHVGLFHNDETPNEQYATSVDFETVGSQGIDNGGSAQPPIPARSWGRLITFRKTSFGLLGLVMFLGGVIAWFTLRKPKA